MRALTYSRYAPASGLTVRELPDPTPGKGEVLIRTHAVGLNAMDWHLYQGKPLLVRGQEGLFFRKKRIPGADLAGVVTALGDGVTEFAVGDRVMASVGTGAMAELVTAQAGSVTRIADAVTMTAAAATPIPGLTSLQALRDVAGGVDGKKVLIWGASGGVGQVAIQVASALGARRIGAVCSTQNVEWVRNLGAHTVYDYTEAPVVGNASGYDVILDTVTTARAKEVSSVLAQDGVWLLVGAIAGGPVLGPVGPMLRALIGSGLAKVRAANVLARVTTEDLEFLASCLADGRLTPRIGATYSLERAADAYAVLESGHVAGKLVVEFPQD